MNEKTQMQELNPAYNNGNPYDIIGMPMLDPLAYRPKKYVLNALVDTALNGTGEGSVPLDKYPFIWTKTTYAIQSEAADAQDNQWLVQVQNVERFYTNDFARPDNLWGDPRTGVVIPYDCAIFVAEATTIKARFINLLGRQGEQFKIELVFHGFERWKAPQTTGSQSGL